MVNVIKQEVRMEESLRKRLEFICKLFLKVHNCCAVNLEIIYNILQAIYLSFKGGILS